MGERGLTVLEELEKLEEMPEAEEVDYIVSEIIDKYKYEREETYRNYERKIAELQEKIDRQDRLLGALLEFVSGEVKRG